VTVALVPLDPPGVDRPNPVFVKDVGVRPRRVIGEGRSDQSRGGNVQTVGQRVADRQIRPVTIETGDPVVGSIE
jgi:hypothetical protein